MARRFPQTQEQWLKEILLAMKNAKEDILFAQLMGARLTQADLFQLAHLVCLKFRGRKVAGEEADRVREGALTNYVVNTGKGLEENPQLAFALCYIAAHLILDLIDEPSAEEIMDYCEDHLPG